MTTAQDSALRIDSLTKSYAPGSKNPVLQNVSLDVRRASFIAIMGPSGSGKSTLLQCAAGLDKPTTGKVLLGETDLTVLDEKTLTRIRRQRIGFIFQAFNLLPMLNVYENVILPLRLSGATPETATVMDTLKQVGLAQEARSLPSELSGGQQQRVAIARTLVQRPEVLFADEPTGSLDTVTARQILDLLRQATHTHGQTVVMVTHDPAAASWADEVIFLVDGRIQRTIKRPSVAQITQEISGWKYAGH